MLAASGHLALLLHEVPGPTYGRFGREVELRNRPLLSHLWLVASSVSVGEQAATDSLAPQGEVDSQTLI